MEFNKTIKLIKSEVVDVSPKGIVSIQITQFDKFDSDNDRLLKGALTKTWQEGGQVHLLDHIKGISSYVGLPISKDSENGIIESKLNLNKQIAKDLFEDYKFSQENGRTLQHSHGFLAFRDKSEKNDKGGYDFKEVRQFEYSTVLFGAISDTPLHRMKSKTDIIDDILELELKLKCIDYSDEVRNYINENILKLKSLVSKPSNDTLAEKTKEPFLDTQEYLLKNFKL